MTTVSIPFRARKALSDRMFVRNGTFPSPYWQSYLQEETNHLAWVRSKCVCSFSNRATNTVTVNAWRSVYHSGPFAYQLWVRFECMQTGADGASLDPYAKLLVELTDGTDVGSVEFHSSAGAGSSGTANPPSTWKTGTLPLRASWPSGDIVELDPQTDYVLTFTDADGNHTMSACVFEKSMPADTANGYLPDGVVQGGPIFDEDRGDMITMLRTMWKRGQAVLFTESSMSDASSPTRTSATPANWLDQAFTSNTAASPGFGLKLANRTTAARDGVPCKLWVYGKSTGTGTGHVHLESEDASDHLDIEIDANTDAWYSAEGVLPASDQKWDIMFYGNGTDQLTVRAVCLIRYED